METMLEKYKGNDSEFLVYDTEKYQTGIKPRAVRSICSRNFGLGVAGLMIGPIRENGSLMMKIYAPDGEERPMEKDALAAGECFLQDAGYLPMDTKVHESAGRIGKIFLSENFVQTYMAN